MRSTDAWGTVIVIFIVAIILIGPKACSYQDCVSICEANGAKTAWKIMEGCYCQDSRGVFNPKDERGNGTAPKKP